MKYHKKSWRVEETQAGVTREMSVYAKVITGSLPKLQEDTAIQREHVTFVARLSRATN